MAHFKFAVSGQFLDLLTPTKGISDGLYVNSFEFDFRSPEWANCAEKWVHFYNSDFNNGIPYDFNLVDDSIAPERGVNLPAGIWEVYLHGSVIISGEVIKRYVTESQSIQILQSGIINAEPLASLEPSVAEQLSALVAQVYNARITTASATIDDGYGTPEVDVGIEGSPSYKNIKFDFHNLKGTGIDNIVFTAEGENKGLVTVTLTDGRPPIVYDGLREAIASIVELSGTISQDMQDLAEDLSQAEDARVEAEEDRVEAEEDRAEAEQGRTEAEAGRVAAEARREHVYEDVVFRSVGIAFSDDFDTGEVIISAVSSDPVFLFEDDNNNGEVVIIRVPAE